MSSEKEGSCWCHGPGQLPGREQLSRSQPRPVLCSRVQMAFYLCSDRGRAIEALSGFQHKTGHPAPVPTCWGCVVGQQVRASCEELSFPSRQRGDGTACTGAGARLRGVSKASPCARCARRGGLSLFPRGFVPLNLRLQNRFQQERDQNRITQWCRLYLACQKNISESPPWCLPLTKPAGSSEHSASSSWPETRCRSPFHPDPRAALEVSGTPCSLASPSQAQHLTPSK